MATSSSERTTMVELARIELDPATTIKDDSDAAGYFLPARHLVRRESAKRFVKDAATNETPLVIATSKKEQTS
jgi:hypothetical protein